MAMANVFVRAVIIVASAFGVQCALAQADPFWLKSWNEAQQSRPAHISSTGRIAPATEPGTPLSIRGMIVEPDGRTPAEGVVVHAYHRDQQGFDFGRDDREFTTWRLQGWAKTDARGFFEFDTIRPAPDHMGRDAAHVHFTLESAKHGRQWANTVYVSDDPRVPKKIREQSAAEGEFGRVRDVESVSGVQRINVKFRLKEKADF
jgi:protocatechuate 3,4-dioxygenase beta subunit